MPLIRVPVIEGTSGGTPLASSPQRAANMFPVVSNAAKFGATWKNCPGWKEWLCVGHNPLRAGIVFKKLLYVVSEDIVYQISKNKTFKIVGRIGSKTGPVSMAEDGINMLIADENQMYRWNETVFELVSLPFLRPRSLINHDGHFIAHEFDSGRFFISDKFDGTTWDALQFATAEDKSDNIVQLLSDRLLWIYGDISTQPYNNNGQQFPFTPNLQGRIIYGMAGTATAVRLDNTNYWLAQSEYGDVKVVRANGFAPQAVSTPEIEEEISSFTRIDDAYARAMMWEGHEWYILIFPSEKRTFVYDTNGFWFEWGKYDNERNVVVDHPMVAYVSFERLALFLSEDGCIYQIDNDTYKQGDDNMVREWVTRVQNVDEQRIFVNKLILDMRTGMANSNIEMCVSYDGGNTFGNWQTRTTGNEGVYTSRVQWDRLGSGYNVVFKFRVTDDVPTEIMSCIVDADVEISYLDRRNARPGFENEIR